MLSHSEELKRQEHEIALAERKKAHKIEEAAFQQDLLRRALIAYRNAYSTVLTVRSFVPWQEGSTAKVYEAHVASKPDGPSHPFKITINPSEQKEVQCHQIARRVLARHPQGFIYALTPILFGAVEIKKKKGDELRDCETETFTALWMSRLSGQRLYLDNASQESVRTRSVEQEFNFVMDFGFALKELHWHGLAHGDLSENVWVCSDIGHRAQVIIRPGIIDYGHSLFEPMLPHSDLWNRRRSSDVVAFCGIGCVLAAFFARSLTS